MPTYNYMYLTDKWNVLYNYFMQGAIPTLWMLRTRVAILTLQMSRTSFCIYHTPKNDFTCILYRSKAILTLHTPCILLVKMLTIISLYTSNQNSFYNYLKHEQMLTIHVLQTQAVIVTLYNMTNISHTWHHTRCCGQYAYY